MIIVLTWPETDPATGVDFDSHLFIPYTFDNGKVDKGIWKKGELVKREK